MERGQGACLYQTKGSWTTPRGASSAPSKRRAAFARSIAHLDDIIGALARCGTPTVSIVLASKSRPIRAGVRRN
jgi:hypothetical protein